MSSRITWQTAWRFVRGYQIGSQVLCPSSGEALQKHAWAALLARSSQPLPLPKRLEIHTGTGYW